MRRVKSRSRAVLQSGAGRLDACTTAFGRSLCGSQLTLHPERELAGAKARDPPQQPLGIMNANYEYHRRFRFHLAIIMVAGLSTLTMHVAVTCCRRHLIISMLKLVSYRCRCELRKGWRLLRGHSWPKSRSYGYRRRSEGISRSLSFWFGDEDGSTSLL